ncbi:MAG: hypothetical protein JO121_07260 [Deltaproteobacteria bacterium]|nr:hypothetical protein [Deltaproteobacteria bacterium]
MSEFTERTGSFLATSGALFFTLMFVHREGSPWEAHAGVAHLDLPTKNLFECYNSAWLQMSSPEAYAMVPAFAEQIHLAEQIHQGGTRLDEQKEGLSPAVAFFSGDRPH